MDTISIGFRALRASVDHLRKDGVVVMDDMDLACHEAWPYMEGLGFRCLNLYGLKPMAFKRYCTTLFYRSNNCLQI